MLMDGMIVGTMGTVRITVNITQNGAASLTIGDVIANLIAADIVANNGAVESIDAVLVPAAQYAPSGL